MITRLERCMVLLALIAGGLTATACGGDDEGQQKLESAIDSLTTQRDSTMARMDSSGVVHVDSTRSDSARRDSGAVGSTTSPRRP